MTPEQVKMVDDILNALANCDGVLDTDKIFNLVSNNNEVNMLRFILLINTLEGMGMVNTSDEKKLTTILTVKGWEVTKKGFVKYLEEHY